MKELHLRRLRVLNKALYMSLAGGGVGTIKGPTASRTLKWPATLRVWLILNHSIDQHFDLQCQQTRNFWFPDYRVVRNMAKLPWLLLILACESHESSMGQRNRE